MRVLSLSIFERYGMAYPSEDVEIGHDDIVVGLRWILFFGGLLFLSTDSRRGSLRRVFRLGGFFFIDIHSDVTFRRRGNGREAIPMHYVGWHHVCFSKLFDAAQRRFQCFKNGGLECRMMSNELIDGGANEDSILLVNQDLQMSLGGEQREDGGNDTWAPR